jgi:hypothetical protein
VEIMGLTSRTVTQEHPTVKSNEEQGHGLGRDKLRRVLEANRGEWVSAWDLSRICIEYKRPIWELRHKCGLTIENKTKRQADGTVYGYYRLPRHDQELAPELPTSIPSVKESPQNSTASPEQDESGQALMFGDLKPSRPAPHKSFADLERGA